MAAIRRTTDPSTVIAGPAAANGQLANAADQPDAGLGVDKERDGRMARSQDFPAATLRVLFPPVTVRVRQGEAGELEAMLAGVPAQRAGGGVHVGSMLR
jgi:hypothetical protein